MLYLISATAFSAVNGYQNINIGIIDESLYESIITRLIPVIRESYSTWMGASVESITQEDNEIKIEFTTSWDGTRPLPLRFIIHRTPFTLNEIPEHL